jgi:phospholipid/cholesterol/gamma-HCH transport system permease protein
VYSVIKAVCFGGAIAIVCAYEGYVTGAGAEGVGRSTAKAVVIASTSILVLDAIVAAVFAQFIAA